MNPPTDTPMKPTQTHTPGPWRADILDSYGRFEIRQSDGGRMFAQGRSWGDGATAETQEANARLIAAAPDLLAALEAMVIANHGLPANPAEEVDLVCRAALEQARAAIARATGQP